MDKMFDSEFKAKPGWSKDSHSSKL